MKKRQKKKLAKRFNLKKYNTYKYKIYEKAINNLNLELEKAFFDFILFGEGRLLVTSETIKHVSILTPLIHD